MSSTRSTIRTVWQTVACGMLSLLAVPVLAQAPGADRPPLLAGGVRVSADHERFIGPGKVVLSLTPAGRWTHFTPAWSEGRSMIVTGGLVVFADSAGGMPREVANTIDGMMAPHGRILDIGRCCEGMKGGYRAPAAHPDDDGDGRVDEDRLDGVDNDGDGLIDEDFAAIGDEMIVADYATERSSVATLHFHQEAYAWSLPHIDGAIMMSVVIENAGTELLENVRVAAYFEKSGPFRLSPRVVARPAPSGSVASIQADAVVCSEPGGLTMALVGLPRSAGDRWRQGYVSAGADYHKALLENVSQSGERMTAPFVPLDHAADDDVGVYVISPRIERLAPGDEIRVEFALVAVRQAAKIDEALRDVFKTFVGDGVNSYLPPPVAMTPKVIWGTYATDDSGVSSAVIEFEALNDEAVKVKQILFFKGIRESAVERDGDSIVLHGEPARKMLRKGGRVTLKGRLDTGEFFEAILRPSQPPVETDDMISKEAETFWKTPGKLGQDLLTGSPNPFRDVTTISYEIPSLIEQEDGSQIQTTGALETSIKVYNVVGRLVAVLVDEREAPGPHTTDWRAIDEHGTPVASGVYYVKLQIEKKFITKRFILLK